MSEPTTTPEPEPTPEPLRDPQTIPSEITFDAPHILTRLTLQDGFPALSVREGRAQQVAMESEISWSETPVDESAQVFAIRARNVVNVAGQKLSVINDAGSAGEIKLAASNPTASEYLSKRGQRVMIHFTCTADRMESQRLGRKVYKVGRSFINLP